MEKIKRKDVSAERAFPSGAWNVSAIVNGYLMRRTYFGYTKREAIDLFIAEANG